MNGAATFVGGGYLKSGFATGVYKGEGLISKVNIKGNSYVIGPPETHCCN